MSQLNYKIIVLVAVVSLGLVVRSDLSDVSSSFDSLISSQCKARCLSLYPWKLNSSSSANDRKFRSSKLTRSLRNNLVLNKYTNYNNNLSESNHHQNHNVKWHKVMELCSKNQNCLQCSLPCDIPTNLLPNCKYLCKQRHPLCIESCNLLNKLNEEKYGSCPSVTLNSLSRSELVQQNKCTNSSRAQAINSIISNEREDTKSVVTECNKDSECVDIRKCCAVNPECPEQGNVCQKPHINNQNLPSIPFNLTITERKKGKTVILSWDSVYNKNKPTLFVVEGRWSLKSGSNSQNSDNFMSKWGYLAQTVNNNWVILRSINRGRWYKFRVASISKSGSYGYSQPTELFILSSPPKPPSQPQNLTAVQVYQTSEPKYVNVELAWLPSKRSDLPISDYKITWQLVGSNESLIQKEQDEDDLDHDYEETDDSNLQSDSYLKIRQDVENSPDSGFDLISSQATNKHTIKNLLKNSVYFVELVALSTNDKKVLVSSPIRIRVDTSHLTQTVQSSTIMSDRRDKVQMLKLTTQSVNDYEDEEDDDLENDAEVRHQPIAQAQMYTRNSPPDLANRPVIKNLTVQSPYFQNGLVKAKLSWQIEQPNSKTSESDLSQQQASINTKTQIDQPMFTITWFAIKCVRYDSEGSSSDTVIPVKQLPTPITATTINTHFEIYELKYNCDYVVNVKLASSSNRGLDILQSSSINRALPPQIASVQFKVSSCLNIKIVGRIRPICYDRSALKSESSPFDSISTTTSTSFSSTTTASTTVSTTSETPTSTSSTYNYQLPRLQNIRYRLVDKSNSKNLYSVEFLWSLPLIYNRNLLSGFQISVVPKEIPGITSQSDPSGGYFGSVGAIVSKDQQSFVVRQLTPAIHYIFQIQAVGKDNISYGPANSLEFVIEDDSNQRRTESAASVNDILDLGNKLTQIDYEDLGNLEQNIPRSDNDLHPLSYSSASSTSLPNYYQNRSNQHRYSSLNILFLILVCFISNSSRNIICLFLNNFG